MTPGLERRNTRDGSSLMVACRAELSESFRFVETFLTNNRDLTGRSTADLVWPPESCTPYVFPFGVPALSPERWSSAFTMYRSSPFSSKEQNLGPSRIPRQRESTSSIAELWELSRTSDGTITCFQQRTACSHASACSLPPYSYSLH